MPDVGRRERQARLDGHRRRPGQPDDLEEAQHLVLVVRVAHPAVERECVSVASADDDSWAEAPEKGIGVAAAAVQLDGEVVARGAVTLEELLDAALVDLAAGDHVRVRRDDVDVVPRARTPLEELGVPGQAEGGDAGVGVGGAERLERRDGDDEVTDAVRPEHDDAADVVHQRPDRSERPHVQGRGVGDDLGRQRLLDDRLAGGRAHERSPLLVTVVGAHTSLPGPVRSLWIRAWRRYYITLYARRPLVRQGEAWCAGCRDADGSCPP